MPNRLPLYLILLVAFAMGVAETLRPNFGGELIKVIMQLTLSVLAYWWYSRDRNLKKLPVRRGFNTAMVALMVIAIPVYLCQSRGMKQGLIASLKFLLFSLLTIVVVVSGVVVGKLSVAWL